MRNLKKVIILIISISLTSCIKDGESSNSKVLLTKSTLTNVSYGSDSKQTYDIYLPAGRTLDTKIILLIHGGGWSAGDKAEMNDFKDYINRELPDIAVVNMNYRLANIDNPPFPMQIDDITAVVNNLKEKQTEYQIGTDLAFMGISAGGHLSLLWSYAFDTENKVNMVCSIVGPTNFLDDAYINSEDVIIQNLVNQFGGDAEVLANASPLQQLTSNAPPTLLFYGGNDPLVPISQGTDLDIKLTELNVPHEFTLYPNEGHGWVGTNLFDTSVKLKAFIETHL